MQQVAGAAQRQGATTITTLASAGSSGKHSGNILRSLASNFCEPPAGSPSIQWDKMASVNDEIDHPFILHLFFDTAWTAGLLKRAFFGDYDTCADFWNSARGSPASSSTSLPPWTLGSHSFQDSACRTTRRLRVVLAPKTRCTLCVGTACLA